jgi:quercetin dioxygenase-like cupin family protein
LRGHGHLVLAESKIDLVSGDTAFIPRNTVHYFVNQSREVAVALAFFSPAFDGKDTIPVKVP